MKVSFFIFILMFLFNQAVLAEQVSESCENGHICVVNLDKNASLSTMPSVVTSTTSSPIVSSSSLVLRNTPEDQSVVLNENPSIKTVINTANEQSLTSAAVSLPQPNSTQSPPEVFVNRVNPSTQVQFNANPTTGYSWTIKGYDKALVTLEGKYFPSNKHLIGSGGLQQWTITATPQALKKPTQLTKIIFVYSRSWEKNVAPAQTKIVTVQIN